MIVSAAAIMGASLAPARADADTVKIPAMFDAALDASSLEEVRTGLAAVPGNGDEEDLRRKRPDSSDADPLQTNRDADILPRRSNLSSPFAVNRTRNGVPINQQTTLNPPATTNPPPSNNNPPPADNNPPPASNNPPPANNNPPPAQNTIPITNASTLGGVITGSVTTILRRNGVLQ